MRFTLGWVPAGIALAVGAGASTPMQTPATPAGHQQMLAIRAEIARTSSDTNVYTGDAQARAFRSLVADPRFIASPQIRWRHLRALGSHELRLGNTEDAVRCLSEAAALRPRLSPAGRPEEIDRAQLDLAVALLRWGESRNCVARHTSESCILPIGGAGVHQDQEGSRRAITELARRSTREQAPRSSVGSRWSVACPPPGQAQQRRVS